VYLLLYQNVGGWSALRTGLSWLAMNVPFLVLAQFAGHARAGGGDRPPDARSRGITVVDDGRRWIADSGVS